MGLITNRDRTYHAEVKFEEGSPPSPLLFLGSSHFYLGCSIASCHDLWQSDYFPDTFNQVAIHKDNRFMKAQTTERTI